MDLDGQWMSMTRCRRLREELLTMVKAVKKTLSIQQETKKLFTWLTVTNKGSDAINSAALEINGVTKAM